MSQLIYKCIDPRICGLLESGEHTYILRNSNLGKVFVNTEYEGLSNNNKYHNYFDNEFISLNSGQKEFFVIMKNVKIILKFLQILMIIKYQITLLLKIIIMTVVIQLLYKYIIIHFIMAK